METKNITLNFRMTSEQKKKIDAGAKAMGLNRTSYILALVEQERSQSSSMLYYKKTADSLQKVTIGIDAVRSKVFTMNEDVRTELEPLLNELVEGVDGLWLTLK